MALVNAFGDLSLEQTQIEIKALNETMQAVQAEIKALSDTMLYFITATLEKMPILDSNDSAYVQVRTGTLSTVSTVSTVTNTTNLNNFAGGNTALIPYNIGAGAFHIYNNIQVS